MRDATDDERRDCLVAEIVDAHRPQILSAYQDWLTDPADGGPRPAPRRLLDRAADVLDDVRRRLSADDGADPPCPPTVDPRPGPATAGPVGAGSAGDGSANAGSANAGLANAGLANAGLAGGGLASGGRMCDGRVDRAGAPGAVSAGTDDIRCLDALMRIAVGLVAADLLSNGSSVDTIAHFVTVLHRSIVGQLIMAADGYSGYLVDLLHRSHLDERRRVARDLHDLIAHSVAVTLQNLELASVHQGRDEARAQAKLDLAQKNLRDTLDMLRAISHDLRQSAAAEGLTAALRGYVENASFSRETDVRVTGDETAVPPAVQGELFLVLREALRNAHLHGRATVVRLRVDIGADMVRARVSDDGCGFGAATSPDHVMGTGLASMRERVALLGGVIEVDTAEGEGTRVSVRVPLTKAWDESED